MKKMKQMPESSFLELFFGFVSLAFIIGAFFMPDRSTMLSGLYEILTHTGKVSTNYFSVGGYSATFLNMGLVGLICLLHFLVYRGKPNNVSTLAFVLTVGFGSWGINILDFWFSSLGVVLYGLVKKEKLGNLCNAMLFSTGLAPIITDMLIRYPYGEVVGFHPMGWVLAIAVGIFIGFSMPSGMAFSPRVHQGFDLYSAALPMGMLSFFLQAFLFKTMGVAIPAAPSADQLAVASPMIVNSFCLALFGVSIVLAFLLGCTPRDYWRLVTDPAYVNNFSSTYGNAVFLMNFGVYGLMILGYYNLVGATFNGVTFGIIFCMLSCCNSGSHPGNAWPIMAGYMLAAALFSGLSGLAGGDFKNTINSQAIVVGLCFANGLTPVADKYGWQYGLIAAMMHYVLVTSVPNLHGGFCLYNGGFTAALICMILVPYLEHFVTPVEEKHRLKAQKAK